MTSCVFGDTRSEKFAKKSAPKMGVVTSAKMKLNLKTFSPNLTSLVAKPQDLICDPSIAINFGPEVCLFDLWGKILKEAPVSARKLRFEFLSNKKVLLQFEVLAAGMIAGVSKVHRSSWLDRWLPSFLN